MTNERKPLKVGDRVRLLKPVDEYPTGAAFTALNRNTGRLDGGGVNDALMFPSNGEGDVWERVQPEAPTLPAEWAGNWAKMRVGQRWKCSAHPTPHEVTEVVTGESVSMRFAGGSVSRWRVDSKWASEFIASYTLVSDVPAEKAQEAKRFYCPFCAVTTPHVHGAATATPPAKVPRPTAGRTLWPCVRCEDGTPVVQGRLCLSCEADLIPPAPKPAPRASRVVGSVAWPLDEMARQHPVIGMRCKGVR